MKKLYLIVAVVLLLAPGFGYGMNNAAQDLLAAARDNNLEDMQAALEADANVNAADNHGWTPLYWAAVNNNLEMVNLLVGAGVNVNVVSIYGITPLFEAARRNNLEIVNVLLDTQGIEYDMVINTLARLQNRNINNPCTASIQEWLENFDAGLK